LTDTVVNNIRIVHPGSPSRLPQQHLWIQLLSDMCLCERLLQQYHWMCVWGGMEGKRLQDWWVLMLCCLMWNCVTVVLGYL